ncbi:MAG: PEGA domain-containing protein [Deltaproteobacteria bacterium]|nr:MAG: PEGA domain-containing protein [Deltaproteobacteria bacterium]
MIVLFLSLLALAQDGASDLPPMNVQTFRPSIDSERTLWTDDTGVVDQGPSARMMLGYQRDPMVLRQGSSFSSVLQDVAQAEFMGGYSYGRLRIGGYVPIIAYASGDGVGQVAGLGDMAVDIRGTVVERAEGPLGLAFASRVSFPTATIDAPLGAPGVGFEFSAILDGEVGPLLLAANLGARGGPGVDLPNSSVGPGFIFRTGAGYALSEGAGISLDVGGQASFAGLNSLAGVPIEALVGGWGHLGRGWTLRGGVGRGLTPGIGAPTSRAVLAIGWQPRPAKDSDGDGILDSDDDCPLEPEDFDGWQDADGCPEPFTVVEVSTVDVDRHPVASARLTIEGESWSTDAGPVSLELMPGTHELDVVADGYLPHLSTIQVPPGPPVREEVVLQPMPAVFGTLELTVKDIDGVPLDGQVRLSDADVRSFRKGVATIEIEPGAHVVTVSSEGYAAARLEAEIEASETTSMTVQLRPIKVKVTQERIEILEKVYFDTAKATIKPESYPLLDDVAAAIEERDDILVVRIEGHTDTRGGREYNFDLSRRRASSVRDYLIGKGIDPSRLVSEGFGFSRPVDPREVPEAWEKNRRVEFVILKWAE